MTLHELITLIILPKGTSEYKEIQYIKYTSEYIMKLQIHQHKIGPKHHYLFPHKYMEVVHLFQHNPILSRRTKNHINLNRSIPWIRKS